MENIQKSCFYTRSLKARMSVDEIRKRFYPQKNMEVFCVFRKASEGFPYAKELSNKFCILKTSERPFFRRRLQKGFFFYRRLLKLIFSTEDFRKVFCLWKPRESASGSRRPMEALRDIFSLKKTSEINFFIEDLYKVFLWQPCDDL